ncbi:cytochrome c3 family protein [Dissulfurirhabdus thermomarina]|uniref:Cytochrome c3 family protein n=1 Tax=Dissulfurirhabdus thermomarina TaxID=1765737 RepID=A0A6N9TPI3_DISTH|nr:cytochrome c3 family protein [Dissulfurirhabdus thermomarina]NDY42958.1 cytochrome c3 family protein [Dissulfurirhabdus thermomarina]NMX24328.1 cytochrome c3 family protein [Dissulfurirhabdus thermomarina]
MKRHPGPRTTPLLLPWIAAALILAVAPAPAAEPPETLTLDLQAMCPDIPGLPANKKAVTDFSHRRHAEVYLPGNQAASGLAYRDDFTCAACHPGAASKAELLGADPCRRVEERLRGAGGPARFAAGYHKTCKGCHKAMKAAGKAAGPTKCAGCHGRKR